MNGRFQTAGAQLHEGDVARVDDLGDFIGR
jgi:hypothetical protein